MEMTEEAKALSPLVVKVGRIMSIVHRGLHHAPDIKDFGSWCEVNEFQDMSTCDSDLLTRLVILAHEEAVRIEATSSGPRMVKFLFHERRRGDVNEMSVSHRHPSIEEAVANVRTAVERFDTDELVRLPHYVKKMDLRAAR